MATLEKIRSRSGLLIASIAIALLCFVVGDALNNSSTLFNNARNVVGEVDGNSMSTEEFQKQVSVMTNVFKMARQPMEDGDVRDAVWNTFIQSVVVGEEAGENGMTVTAAELKDATLGENVHPMMRSIPLFYNQENQFDKNILLNVLANMDKEGNEELKDYWMFWENRIKEQIQSEKLTRFVNAAMSAPKAETKFLSTLFGKDVKVAYVAKQYRELPDSLFKASDEELNKKYAENKKLFKTEPFRRMKCIVFDVRPSQDDQIQTEEKVKSAEAYLKQATDEELPYFVSQESDAEVPFNPFYQTENDVDYSIKDFAFSAKKDSVCPTFLDGQSYKTAKVLSDAVVRADSVNVNVLPVMAQSIDAAKATADSLFSVLNAGADFKEIATKHAVDPNTRSNGGEWGWIREGASGSADFDNAVFSAAAGSLVKVETPQAIFLVKVNEKTAPVKKVRLAVISNKVVPSGDTYRQYFEKANSFIAKNNTQEKFLAAAEAEGYLVRELGPVSENQSNLYVLENGRPIIKWAFEANLGDVCKKPFDSKDKYVICSLSEIVDGDYVPASNSIVKGRLESMVANDKKAEKLLNELSGVSDLASAGSVDTATVSFDMNGTQAWGQEPGFVATIAKAEANKVSSVKGENGVYLFKVLESNDSPLSEARAEGVKNNVRSYVYRTLLSRLMEDAEVEDNRSRFY